MTKAIKILNLVLTGILICSVYSTTMAQTNADTQNQLPDLITEVEYQGNTFVVVAVDTKGYSLELHNTGNQPWDYKTHEAKKQSEQETIFFAVSAAPVKSAGIPYGLILKDGQIKTGGAGFQDGAIPVESLKGIFSYLTNGNTRIAPSSTYAGSKATAFNFAIESSPMLLTQGALSEPLGAINNKQKMSVITLNPKGEVVFVIAKTQVTYAQMADFVSNSIQGKDALLLRGEDTSYYSPDMGVVNESRKSFGPIFIVSKQLDQSGASIAIDQEQEITEELTDITFLGKRYIVCKVNTKDYDVRLYNQMDKGAGIYDFPTIDAELKANKEQHIFSMNAGMFDRQRLPIGLFMVNGDEKEPINLHDSDPTHKGNFYDFPPNGIFSIDKKGIARVSTRDDFVQNVEPKKEILWATQSGPMMVVNGDFNKAFNQGSTNLNIRNGVGINDKGEILMVISLQPVNFYEFSQLFKEKLACDNALYLDGFLSQWYAPGVNTRVNSRQPLGPLMTVIKK